MKDAQQVRVYRAEFYVTAHSARLADLGAARAYLRDVIVPAFPIRRMPVVVEGRNGQTRSWYHQGYISLCTGGMNEYTLIHEYVHALLDGTRGIPAHGGEFVRQLLDCTGKLLGSDEEQVLLDGLRRHKVIFELEHQRAAAWKQLLRLRSDAKAIGLSDVPAFVTYTLNEQDWNPAHYVTYSGNFKLVGDDLMSRTGFTVSRRQLRYASGEMLRRR